MNQSRVAVEWFFGDISNFFAFLDFKKNLKIGLSSVERCTLVVHSWKMLDIAYMDVRLFGLYTPNLMHHFQ